MKPRYPVVTVCAILLTVTLQLACTSTRLKELCSTPSSVLDLFNLLIKEFLCPSFGGENTSICRSIARNNALMPTFEPQGDIQVKNGGAKYKYKSDYASEAQQNWKMKGECDTQVSSFSKYTLMTVNLGVGHDGAEKAPDQVTHTFTPDKVSRNGRRFKSRFEYYPTRHTARHTHTHLPAFGKCFGKIGKDGKLTLWYGVWKANEGGLMMTDGFSALKTETIQMESNKYTAAGFVHAGVRVGAEQHSVETMAKAKTTRKGTKLKVLQK